MTLIVSLFALPFLVWSWVKHDVDEDAIAALSIIGWMIVVGAAAAAWWLVA